MSELPIRQPEMIDLGIAYLHDYPCPVCRSFHAVLNMEIGVMEPCWRCQKTGWRVMMPWTWQRRWWDRLKGKLTRQWAREQGSTPTNGADDG